jgi:membrane protein
MADERPATMNPLDSLQDFFRLRLWQDEGLSYGRLLLFKGLRLLILAWQGLIRNHSLVQASSLAYSTFLALIPLLALLFAILKGLGIQRLLSAHLLDRLAPGSQDFAAQIFQYIEETKVTTLGVFGVVFLLAALVVVMTNVERAFNETWGVPQTRSWRRKLSDYLSIFLFFPILMAVAISVTSNFLGHPDIRRLLAGILPEVLFAATSGLVSLFIMWLAFTFIYLVMPNTRVHFRSAVIGGIAGGTVWQIAQEIFIWFQGAATYYNLIYGALYHLLFLVIWMFWSWLIVLFGTEVAYAHQHLERLSREFRRPPRLPEPVDEYLALAALVGISVRFARRQPPMTLEELGQLLPGGDHLAPRVVQTLKDCELAVQVASADPHASPGFLPGQPLDQVTVGEVLTRLGECRSQALAQALEEEPGLAATLSRLMEGKIATAGASLTLKELVESLD